ICARAVVSMEFGMWPALARTPDSAIEKHPAWAAASSSSGLVPEPSSNREVAEKGPSQFAIFIVPDPFGRSPSHRASALRTGMLSTLVGFNSWGYLIRV